MNDDVDALRQALTRNDDEISVTLSLPRHVAQHVLDLLEAERHGGAIVVPAKAEFSTAEAATILSIPRPRLLELLNAGEIEHRTVGTHRRITARSVITFQETELARRRAAMEELAAPSDELGWID